jgi:RNA polymerase sigma factor FliA
MSGTSHLNRRQLLGGLLAGGAAATALPLLGAESAAAAPASAPGILAERWREYARTGDSKARDDLVLAYSPIVKYTSGRVASRLPAHIDAADLMSDDFKGLMDAVERFDATRGIPFDTYAERRIHGAIHDGLRSSEWVPHRVRIEARRH